MMIRFIRKSNTAFVSRLDNNKFYFISEINKKFLSDEFTSMKNGEVCYITKIEVLDKVNRKIKLSIFRQKDNTEFYIREEDIVYFGG